MVIILAMMASVIILTVHQNSDSRIEVLEAEVEDIWTLTIEDETGGHQIQNVRLKHGDKSFACQLSPIFAGQVYQLKSKKPYQFKVNHTQNHCYIIEVFEATK